MRFRWSDDGLEHLTRDLAHTLSAGPDATDEQHQRLRRAEKERAVDAMSGDYLGLIAQEVETVVPEVVHDDEDGYKSIRYQQLTALLIEAIKEQDTLVRALSAKVEALETAP